MTAIPVNTDICNPSYITQCLQNNIFRIRREGREALKPPPDITVSQWAEQNRMLPETNYKAGQWKNSNAPHLKEIMDCANDPLVREITIQGSSQIGKTEAINNILGYFIDIDPCNIIIMYPTDADVKKYVAQKLDPMIEDTTCLRNKVGRKRKQNGSVSKEKEDSTYRKRFVGGNLQVITGRSTSATRGSTARVTWDDDIDAIEIGHTKEGDPVTRLKKRSTRHPDRLNIHSSSPSITGQSRVETFVADSDERHLYVKCPVCNHEQEMIPEQLHWEKELDMFGKVVKHHEETVKYKCINSSCSALLNEAQRYDMLQKAVWKKERPYIKHHAGFVMGEISWADNSMESIARQITESKVDIIFDEKGHGSLDTSRSIPEKLEALVNTVFGRTFSKVLGEETDPIELMDRAYDFIDKNNIKVPNQVVLLTAFVDLQAGMNGAEARLDIMVTGWGVGEENWIIFKGTIPGELQKKAVWNQLDKFWLRKWKREDGVELSIKIKLIDSGYLAQTVYDYVRYRQKEGIYASKGANKYGAPLLPRKASLVDKGRVKLIVIGTQAAKHEIFSRLKTVLSPGPKYTHFPKCFCNAAFFKEMCAEVAVKKTTGLIDYIVYEKKEKQAPNEAIDQTVGNYAAMKMYTVFAKLETLAKRYNKSLVENKIDYVEPIETPENKPTEEPAEKPKIVIKKKKRMQIKIS